MKRNNNKVDYQVREEMNRRFPNMKYRNTIVAGAIAEGHKEQLTSDWIRKAFISDIEDGFMTYEKALEIKDEYSAAIEEMKRIY